VGQLIVVSPVVTDTADLTGAKVLSCGEGGRSCQVYKHILNGTYCQAFE
jgi:hypothetical protein